MVKNIENISKFLFSNARPLCKTCCYFRNAIEYIDEIINEKIEENNIKTENNEKKVDK